MVKIQHLPNGRPQFLALVCIQKINPAQKAAVRYLCGYALRFSRKYYKVFWSKGFV